MTDPTPAGEIADFFDEFQRASAAEDWGHYGELFLPQFMNLDPSAAGAVSRDDLIAFLPHRKAVFERAGATGTALTQLELESVDERHALARTRWQVLFDHDRTPVELRTTFLLRREDRWRIAVYLNHGSLLQLLASEPQGAP